MPAKPASRTALPGRRRRAPGRTRGLAIGAILLLALLVATHGGLWLWTAGRIEEVFDRWVAQRRDEGWQVTQGERQRDGWPWQVGLALSGLRLERPDMAWEVGTLRLVLLASAPERLMIEAAGPQRLRLGTVEILVLAERLEASMPFAPARPGLGALPPEAIASAERLSMVLPAGPLEIRGMRLALDSRADAGQGEAALTLRGAADAASLPPSPAGAALAATLGNRVEEVRFDLALTGPVPQPAITGAPAARGARLWRDGGGRLDLRGLALRWGAASASGSAVLALDRALQPAGSGSLRLVGSGAVLDAAAQAGLLPPRSAGPLRLLAQMMEQRPAEGGPPALEVPLSLEDRMLGLSGFPLVRLPEMEWQAPPPPAAVPPRRGT